MTDWSQLGHAYGPATDTPAQLEALLGGSPSAIEAAKDHLWGPSCTREASGPPRARR